VVYVVSSSGSVERRPVTVARRGQKDIAIAKGLQKGERVVIGESVRRLAAAEGGTR
jgi:multidrug efflux pump subunit AcrA (membrane-fusion protein)